LGWEGNEGRGVRRRFGVEWFWCLRVGEDEQMPEIEAMGNEGVGLVVS